jgi:hypothetical protein
VSSSAVGHQETLGLRKSARQVYICNWTTLRPAVGICLQMKTAKSRDVRSRLFANALRHGRRKALAIDRIELLRV